MSNTDTAADALRSVLVPTDGSDAAEAALERAIAIADREGATVHVLTVMDTTSGPLSFGIDDIHELEDVKERLVADLAASADDHDIDVTGAVRRGRPAEEIITYAAEHDIDQIVLGRTGRGAVTEALLGSTADQVVRTATVPVLVVPDATVSDDE
ncbi:universal stress protein [Natronorubrum bangense]|uniref:UspA domain-containing protein n=2 Tax=Natronorubrum bangense TaxID=61858 RepID=L9WD62_9EURY|nr:universal stress protein [Natronorubrum bangense]ELY47206.1 UspA domain-containing protein [Natronorubrum bangense JCM 10635]QCC53363.1 universal stress protein [Natronorubrum bangense]